VELKWYVRHLAILRAAFQVRISPTTSPCTSVSRKSRPL
jgi:hypothetical protein